MSEENAKNSVVTNDPSAPHHQPPQASLAQQVEDVAQLVIKRLKAQQPPPDRSRIAGPAAAANAGSEPTPRRFSRLKHFAGPAADQQAYAFGRWVMAALGSAKSQQFCQDHGIGLIKAHSEGINSQGGFLVPDVFENTLIDLREQYGVFRRNARVVPMTSDTLYVPRRTSGLTTYWVGENSPITESAKGWDRVGLVARKLGVLTKYSSELAEDAVISLADDLAGEIAYAFALKEDQTGFNGDGTSSYAGIRGVMSRLGTAGVATQAVGDEWSELTLADFNAAISLLPEYADGPNAKWYCSRSFFGSVIQKLVYAAGGNTVEHVHGTAGKTFLGYPVEITQVLPTTTATSTVCCLFGNLRLAAMFGDRRATEIAFSQHVNFAEDELAIRGTERFDINVHDAGDATSAGPIVGLKTGA